MAIVSTSPNKFANSEWSCVVSAVFIGHYKTATTDDKNTNENYIMCVSAMREGLLL